MSTWIEIVGVDVPEPALQQALATGRRLAEEWECRFSRFRPDSILSRLNAANGIPIEVDQTFLEMLDDALAGVRRTGGMFDPSILPSLEAAGYSRSIEQVTTEPVVADAPVGAAGLAAWHRVVLERRNDTVQLPAGMRIDLGGIAKGAFVDRLAAELGDWPGGAVDAGGDMRVWGVPPSGDTWDVGVENPQQPDTDILSLRVVPGRGIGVATSGTYRRRWRSNGQTMHHLIDPRGGQPIRNGVQAVTAIAASVTAAEIATKGLMLTVTREEVTDLFGARCAVVVFDDGDYRIFDRNHYGQEWNGAAGCACRAA
ncbi:MAG: FAD:protein FMN transferase [Thermomicrobiales bacterium]